MSVFDPRDRELCVDGGCIGLVGQDGYCKECGKPGASARLDPRRRGLRDESEIMEELDRHIIKGDMMPAPEGFEERRLCPDGTCIGLLGKDGRCGECGGVGRPSVKESDRVRSSDAQGAYARAGIANDDDRNIDSANELDADDDLAGDVDGGADSDEFDDRRLCTDGACIGLIGRDGRCRECGLPG